SAPDCGGAAGRSATMPTGNRARQVPGECWPFGTSKYSTEYPLFSSVDERRRFASSSDGAAPPSAPLVSAPPTSMKNLRLSFGDEANCWVSHSYGGSLVASLPRQNAPLWVRTFPKSAGYFIAMYAAPSPPALDPVMTVRSARSVTL